MTLNKTLMENIQNDQKSIGKSLHHMDFKNFKKKIRERRFAR